MDASHQRDDENKTLCIVNYSVVKQNSGKTYKEIKKLQEKKEGGKWSK